MKSHIIYILVEQKKYRDPDYNATRMAAELGISASALSRLLKKEFDKSYSTIVNELRIRDAMKYLTSPQKRSYLVDDIGVLVGFRNRTSFYEAFRKYTGCSPDVYRNERSANAKELTIN